LGTNFVTASGRWVGGGDTVCTLLFPMGSIQSIDLTAREVTEDSVPKEHQGAVKAQISQLSPTEKMG